MPFRPLGSWFVWMICCGAMWTKIFLSIYAAGLVLVVAGRCCFVFAGLFVSSVVREHGRDGNLHQSQQDFRPVSSLLGFPLWCFFSLALFCGVLYDAGAAHLPFFFDFSWLYCRFVSCVSCVLAYREANLAHIIVRFPYCLSVVGCLVCSMC